MPTKEDALSVVDSFIKRGEEAGFSYIAITGKQVADILQKRFDTENHSMPSCCQAMEEKFQTGRDFFRRGKNRHEWYDRINHTASSTFEILYALPR
jgi:hypothetical protein